MSDIKLIVGDDTHAVIYTQAGERVVREAGADIELWPDLPLIVAIPRTMCEPIAAGATARQLSVWLETVDPDGKLIGLAALSPRVAVLL
jgi:hypothetical protein